MKLVGFGHKTCNPNLLSYFWLCHGSPCSPSSKYMANQGTCGKGTLWAWHETALISMWLFNKALMISWTLYPVSRMHSTRSPFIFTAPNSLIHKAAKCLQWNLPWQSCKAVQIRRNSSAKFSECPRPSDLWKDHFECHSQTDTSMIRCRKCLQKQKETRISAKPKKGQPSRTGFAPKFGIRRTFGRRRCKILQDLLDSSIDSTACHHVIIFSKSSMYSSMLSSFSKGTWKRSDLAQLEKEMQQTILSCSHWRNICYSENWIEN